MSIVCPKSIREEISTIIRAALKSVDPYKIVKERIKLDRNSLSIGSETYDLDQIDRLFLIGFGKAVIPMATGILDVVGDLISNGVLIPKYDDRIIVEKFPETLQVISGDHPIPSKKSIDAARGIVELLSSTKKDDLVIGLISGGGSSLAALPIVPIDVEDLNFHTQALLRSGASIHEINTIRKHLDLFKGGGLLRYIDPARSLHLILSDVIGNDLSVIASGPTSPDPTTFNDAIDTLRKYDLWEKAPDTIRDVLSKGQEGKIRETIKIDDPLLEKTNNQIIGSLLIAANAAMQEAESLGFHTEIYDLTMAGEARVNGMEFAQYIKCRKMEMSGSKTPICIIAGGETTVTVTGEGIGGRNQELALGAALKLSGVDGVHFFTLATDGEDGPTDAAGAYVDGQTIQRAQQLGLDPLEYLQNNDAYNFFRQTGELIITGPTGTNVNDLVFIFLDP